MKLIQTAFIVTLVLCLVSCKQQKQQETASENTYIVDPSLPWSQRMAETLMLDFPEMWRMEEGKGIKWAYTKGLACSAFLDLWKASGNRDYFNYAQAYADTMINEDGIIYGYKMEDYNIDKINPAKMLLDLYDETKDPRYETALKTLRQQLVNHPRTEAGGFWHKKRWKSVV